MWMDTKECKSANHASSLHLLAKTIDRHCVKQDEPMVMEVSEGRSDGQFALRGPLVKEQTLYMLKECSPMERVRREGRSRSSSTEGEYTLGMQWFSTTISCNSHRETKDTVWKVLPDMERKRMLSTREWKTGGFASLGVMVM